MERAAASPLGGADIVAATDWALAACAGASAHALGRLCVGEWPARRVLDHLVDALLLYAGAVARRCTEPAVALRNGDPGATPDELRAAVAGAAAVLGRLVDAMGPDERAAHPSGLADATGWAAMACTELLVHGHDLAVAVGAGAPAPDDLAGRVVDRALPWAPEAPGMARLLWATGRSTLDGRPPAGPDWWWQSAPLATWDGRPRRRSAPPRW